MIKIQNTELELIKVDGGGSPVYNYKGNPFTGILVGYSKNGHVFVEEEYQNGFQEGWTRFFYENGKVKREYKSHNNLQVEETYKEWDENGNLIESF